MDEMIRQIRAASAADLYYLALFGALTLPDICGALASDDGKASGSKYRAWLCENVPSLESWAEVIYGLRCSLLHQGRALPHKGHYPIAFAHPGPGQSQIHNLVIDAGGKRVGWFSIPMFVDEVTQGAESWFSRFGTSRTVTRNLEKFVRIRPEGLPPYVGGVPVIA